VYEAYDTDKGRTVALKILTDENAQDEQFRTRFLRESHAAAIFQEPHVIPIHDWGEIDRHLYIDMRLVRGQSLHDLLKSGPLQPERAVAICQQIAAALDAAHAEGLVHRDVKPQNIIVTPVDFAYLVDCGIAEAKGDTRLTMAGYQVGSFGYMAPERFNDGETTAAVDVYSLACVLYEALTGDVPFPGQSLEQVMAAHLYSPPPRPSAVNPRMPASFDDVIARGMAKEPDDRYGSAGAFGRAAHRALRADGRSPSQDNTMQALQTPPGMARAGPDGPVQPIGAAHWSEWSDRPARCRGPPEAMGFAHRHRGRRGAAALRRRDRHRNACFAKLRAGVSPLADGGRHSIVADFLPRRGTSVAAAGARASTAASASQTRARGGAADPHGTGQQRQPSDLRLRLLAQQHHRMGQPRRAGNGRHVVLLRGQRAHVVLERIR
jgi:hypothetical protein